MSQTGTTPQDDHPRIAALAESCRLDWGCVEDGSFDPVSHRFAVVSWSAHEDRNWAYGTTAYAIACDVANDMLQQGIVPGFIIDTDTGRTYDSKLSVSFPPA